MRDVESRAHKILSLASFGVEFAQIKGEERKKCLLLQSEKEGSREKRHEVGLEEGGERTKRGVTGFRGGPPGIARQQ